MGEERKTEKACSGSGWHLSGCEGVEEKKRRGWVGAGGGVLVMVCNTNKRCGNSGVIKREEERKENKCRDVIQIYS